MKMLHEIITGVKVMKIIGSEDIAIASVQFDSRLVHPGDLFVAVKGTKSDGHRFIDKAIESGAVAILCEHLPEKLNKKTTWVQTTGSARALGISASAFYGNPSAGLGVIGVTGTNGKTTIASLLYEVFQKLGYKSGLISTIQNKIGDRIISSTHTTPDPVQLQSLFNQMVNEKCTHCFMEVSSHAIDQDRIAGIRFAGGIFTNLTHDHLDYHLTIENYLKAKKKFFDELPADAFALSNIDDKNGKVMLQNSPAARKTYSLKSASDFKGKVIENRLEGLQLEFDGQEFFSQLIGKFNAYNLLAVYAAAVLTGKDPKEVLTALSDIKVVEGRFDYIRSQDNIVGIVDYAHTPDALVNVLNTIDAIRTHNETLITVIGAGGDRDKLKRPLMAKAVCEKSDLVILTSDNPRTENPDEIIRDMQKGIDPSQTRKVISITNRKEAIKTACHMARTGDIILVAGKGHEKYQEIRGMKHPFDDKEILKNFLLTRVIHN
jgi:UDP-N-acetylmuramoyl-L-alanyl-D-glutamate--2,6-diaminopimelate ligase